MMENLLKTAVSQISVELGKITERDSSLDYILIKI